MFDTDAFLVSDSHNIFYETGFETTSPQEREAYLLLIKSKKIIITDARYSGARHSVDSELIILQPGQRAVNFIHNKCEEGAVKTLGCEADSLTWREAQQLQKIGIELTPLIDVYSQRRSIKTEEELFAIKQACHIGDLVLKDITPYIHPGQTEKEIAWYIEKSIREGYRGEVAFDPIVAVDAHAATPHYNTKKGEGTIKDGSLLLIDFGVKVHNYCSDITRMVGVGALSDEIKKAYSQLLEVQKKTIEYLQNVDNLKDVDAFCRSELASYSLPNYLHSTGHGVGLEVHESPRISHLSLEKKTKGQVFTIEPGVYMPSMWGMRIEDTIAVSLQGEIEVLTRFPKNLILL